MMELKIQLIPTGEIILSPGMNGENFCHGCKVSSSVRLKESVHHREDRSGPSDESVSRAKTVTQVMLGR